MAGQFMADGFRVINRMVGHADFDPPEAAALVLGQSALVIKIRGVLMLHRPIRRGEGHRTADVAAEEMDRISHRVAARLLRRVGLVEFVTSLRAHPPLASRRVRHNAVARAVNEGFPLEPQLGFGVLHHRKSGGDMPCVPQFHAANVRVQMQGEVVGFLGNIIEHQIPDAVGPAIFINLGVIAGALLDERLRNDAGFARVSMKRRSAVRRDAHLGRTVAAQDGPVVDKTSFRAVAGCGYRRAKAGQTSATDHNIVILSDFFHRTGVYCCSQNSQERSCSLGESVGPLSVPISTPLKSGPASSGV